MTIEWVRQLGGQHETPSSPLGGRGGGGGGEGGAQVGASGGMGRRECRVVLGVEKHRSGPTPISHFSTLYHVLVRENLYGK